MRLFGTGTFTNCLFGSRACCVAVGCCVLAVCFCLDQYVKMVVLSSLNIIDEGPFRLAPFLELRIILNDGIAYGLFSNSENAYLIIFATLCVLLFFVALLLKSERIPISVAYGFMLGGGFGNFTDRVIYGSVLDYIHIHSPGRTISWYVFNLADLWISIGVILVAYNLLKSEKIGW